MNKVAIFRRELLPISETFIKEQALALDGWKPILVGYARTTDGLDLGRLESRILPGMIGTIARHALRLCQLLGLPHPPTVQTLRETEAQLVHAHFGTDATDIWPSTRAAGLPMLVTLHGYDINIQRQWWEAGHGGLLRRLYPRRLLKMAHDPAVRFVAVSEAVKQRAIAFGIPAEKLTTCHIGVDTERFKPGGLPIEQRRNLILFVGRMVEKKAPLLMIRAFNEVRKKISDAELVMIGDGPLLDDVRNFVSERGIPVELPGSLDSHAIVRHLHQSSILCLPSVAAINGDSEGLPICLMEAQACGIPVITSTNGGGEECVIEGVTGRVVREGDGDALVQGIIGLLGDKNLLQRAHQAARSHMVQNFDISSQIKGLQNIYHAMVIR